MSWLEIGIIVFGVIVICLTALMILSPPCDEDDDNDCGWF